MTLHPTYLLGLCQLLDKEAKMPKRRLGTSSQPEHEYLCRRSYRACGACRRRKRKCDGQLPCSTCAGYGYHCDYESAQESPSLTEIQERHQSSSAREEESSSRRLQDASAHQELPSCSVSPHEIWRSFEKI